MCIFVLSTMVKKRLLQNNTHHVKLLFQLSSMTSEAVAQLVEQCKSIKIIGQFSSTSIIGLAGSNPARTENCRSIKTYFRLLIHGALVRIQPASLNQGQFSLTSTILGISGKITGSKK